MLLADKLRTLRETEGELRGLARPMTQGELVRALRKETGRTMSQSYLSQIGNARPARAPAGTAAARELRRELTRSLRLALDERRFRPTTFFWSIPCTLIGTLFTSSASASVSC